MKNPKKLFLLDGFGALSSAAFLGFLLPYLHEFVGMPIHILYILAAVAISFAIYSLICYTLLKSNFKNYLFVLALVNFLYACTTIVLVFIFFEQIKFLGFTYFTIEVLILFTLVGIQYRVAKTL